MCANDTGARTKKEGEMSWLPFVVAYAGIGIFLVACVARFLMWKRMPMHLRWELYPVPHEGKRAKHGGSYLEEVDWWKKPRKTDKVAELKAMSAEILFLVALKENNNKLWWRSFPFHFGLYLVIAATCLMLGFAILAAIAPSLMAGGFGTCVQTIIAICGIAGLALGLVGAIGLLERRLNDPELKDFTAPADIFNLGFFVVAFGVTLTHTLISDLNMATATAFVHGLVTFKFEAAGAEGGLFVTSVLLLGGLVAYIPLTHMSHFIAKYFAYHSIRWDDEPNLGDPKREKAIVKELTRPVTWGAPHIDAGGKKNWVDLATEEMEK
jgi:nitrate reductase gamma subunit